MDGPRTILFLHPAPDRYGADVVLLEMVRGLDPERWRAVVALPSGGPLVAMLRAAGAEIELGPLGVLDRRAVRSPLDWLRFCLELPRAVRFVRRTVRRHRAAVVHVNTAAVVGGALGARFSPARCVWHLHEIAARPASAKRFARLTSRLADVVVSNSEATRAAYDAASPELATKHRVVHNGVDPERLGADRVDRAEARSALGVDGDGPVVAMLGRVEAWKGQELLVAAAEKLRFRYPDAQFLLVGDAPPGGGELAQSLAREIEARNLDGFVHCLPYQDSVARVLVAADVVVCPSTRPEPFGLTAVEAMACARPVVAAAHGGLLEVVEAGVTGLFFEPGNADKLGAALRILIDDRARAREMGRHGYARFVERFHATRFADDLDRLWSRLCGLAFHLPADEAEIVHVARGMARGEARSEVEEAVHRLASSQAGRHPRVAVLGAGAEGGAATGSVPYELALFPAGGRPGELDPALARVLDELPVTAVAHLHGAAPELAPIARRLRERRVPYVLSLYGACREGAGAEERAIIEGARRVQARSEREREELSRLVPRERVAVVPLGCAPDSPQSVAFAPLDLRSVRRPLLGYVGPLERDAAGLDLLLDAFALHVAAGREGTLWLVGDGDGAEPLAARVRDLGLARRVTVERGLSAAERRARLAALDAFVHPARRAGMPLAVLDALALGRPVVVTRETDLDADVQAAGAGIVVKLPDVEQLAAALAVVEREHAGGILAARSGAARDLAARAFAPDDVAARIESELYLLDDRSEELQAGEGLDACAAEEGESAAARRSA